MARAATRCKHRKAVELHELAKYIKHMGLEAIKHRHHVRPALAVLKATIAQADVLAAGLF